MKISGAYIDGFGLFHDQHISGLDRRLVLLHGNNEAGKSTLLGFIRSMLFGFPRANSRDSAYPPAAGGVHGGRIDLVSALGDTWSVSRKPGKGGGAVTVTGPDGRLHDKAMLDSLLGGISYEAFKSIQAFGLTELQTMETLSGEHITSAIYGAGLGTAMNAMPRALRQIRKRMDARFKSRASNPAMNRLAGKLDQVRKALDDAALQAGQYDTIVDALCVTAADVAAQGERLAACRREQRRYEALERLWEDWVEYLQHREALDELPPPVEAFPEDGLETLGKLTEAREECEKTLRELSLRREKISRRLPELPVNPKILARSQDIAALLENRNAYSENAASLPALIGQTEEKTKKVVRLLSRLGNGWTEADIHRFDRSLFTRETIRHHQAVLDALEKKIIAADTLLGDKRTAAIQAAEDRLAAEKKLQGAGKMPPRREPEPIRRLEQDRGRMLDALMAQERLMAHTATAMDELRNLEQATARKGPGHKWPAIVFAAVGTAAAGVLVWFKRTNEAATTLVATFAAVWAAWSHRRQRLQLHLNHRELLRRQRLRVEELSDRLRQLESVQDEYFRTAVAAGAIGDIDMPKDAILNAVERFLSALGEEDRLRNAVREARRRLDERKAAETAARRALKKTMADRQALSVRRKNAKILWGKTCAGFGLSAALSPATALEALDLIDETLEALQQRGRCRGDRLRCETQLATYQKAAREVLTHLSWPPTENDDLPRIVDELVARLEESRGNLREQKALGGQIAELSREMAAVEETLAAARNATDRLLERTGLTDEAAFRSIGRRERERREHLAALGRAEANMRRISGEVDILPLKTDLETLALAEITARKEAQEEKIRDLEETLSHLYNRQAEQKQALVALTTTDEVSRLRAREAGLLAELTRDTRDWCRHAIAEHLIKAARDLFERQHQPEIIQNAGEIFRQMTDGRYRGVVSLLGENTLMALDRNGQRVAPEQLSRGTAEQLYLSVRFSYVRHQARKGDPLPVIMDDILVNFDPIRARKAAEAIGDLSASHQVLMFTCHPETVAVFQDIDPEVPVFTLDDGRIFPPAPVLAAESGNRP